MAESGDDREEQVEVEAVRPRRRARRDSARVDVVKVDVEGAEVHAFAGLERTLDANPGITIMFEWSPEQIRQVGDDPAALLELLGRRGLRLRVLEDDLAPIDAVSVCSTGPTPTWWLVGSRPGTQT